MCVYRVRKMKFTFETDKTHTYIHAHFEDADNIIGKREEGAGTEVTIKEKTEI